MATVIAPEYGGIETLLRVRFDDGHESSRDKVRFERAIGQEGPREATEAPVTFSQEDVDRMVQEATARTRTALLEEFEAWKRRASEIACEYADENNLCGEFERCMEDIGLEGRHREYVVSFSLTVTARNDESATAEAIEILASDTWALRNAHDETEEI
jgi:hypothetical protein